MDYQSSFAISAAGMSAERLRVDVAAMNMAHANTPQASRASGYQPMRVVAGTDPLGVSSFNGMVETGLAGLQHVKAVPVRSPARQVYEPGHPQADRKGFVSYPGVDAVSEMMTIMTSTRAFEADVAAFNAARTMAVKALEIGGRP